METETKRISKYIKINFFVIIFLKDKTFGILNATRAIKKLKTVPRGKPFSNKDKVMGIIAAPLPGKGIPIIIAIGTPKNPK